MLLSQYKDMLEANVHPSVKGMAEIGAFVVLLALSYMSTQSADIFSLLNSFTSQQHWAMQSLALQQHEDTTLEQMFPFSRDLADDNKYDQRLPIAALYKKVSRELVKKEGNLNDFAVDFHWGNWMNLGHAGVVINAWEAQGPHTDAEWASHWENLKSLDSYRSVHHPVVNQILHSDVWLYGIQDVPERIDLITDHGYYEIPVKGKRLQSEQELWNDFQGKKHASWNGHSLGDVDLRREARSLDMVNSRYHDQVDWYAPIPEKYDIPDDDMHWDLDEEISKLEMKDELSPKQQDHLNKFKLTRDQGNSAMFFFPINWMENDRFLKGDHCNFPFFQSIVEPVRRRSPIHHMMRNYARFMRQSGYNYWVFSGNAISWYFNGNNMPWDEDIDVRMSAREMDRMSMTHNASLIVENPSEGDGLYYFVISPWFGATTRLGNHIDSRFIDVRTGLYIDITCLYEASEPVSQIIKQDELFDNWNVPKEDRRKYLKTHKVVNDKNGNWFWGEHFTHQFRTLFEGTQVYMPYQYEEVLKYSYGPRVLENKNFDTFRFFPEVGLWVSSWVCNFEKYQNALDEGRGFDAEGRLTEAGSCWNKEIYDEYKRVSPALKLHKKELELLAEGDPMHLNLTGRDLPIYWQDEFTGWYDYYETGGNGNL